MPLRPFEVGQRGVTAGAASKIAGHQQLNLSPPPHCIIGLSGYTLCVEVATAFLSLLFSAVAHPPFPSCAGDLALKTHLQYTSAWLPSVHGPLCAFRFVAAGHDDDEPE